MNYKILPSALLFCVALVSCSDNDTPTDAQNECLLTNVNAYSLLFDDVNLTGFNQTFSGKFNFDYGVDNKIIRVRGGVVQSGALSTLGIWAFSDVVKDTLIYENNHIKVRQTGYVNNWSPYEKKFQIENDRLLFRSMQNDGFSPLEYTYQYEQDKITEYISDNLFRTFYFENGNLTKVERLNYNWQTGEVTGKFDLEFLNYDMAQNWLKGKFYVNGAFYRAFSNNNYTKCKRVTYTFENGQFILYNEDFYSYEIAYDQSNVANIFGLSCQ